MLPCEIPSSEATASMVIGLFSNVLNILIYGRRWMPVHRLSSFARQSGIRETTNIILITCSDLTAQHNDSKTELN
ncbi:hypothetical protein TNCV_4451911 [Trichonephila clavipes]|nr:hypothetical protein TNCV_4451911 [Trichonephila clavipes]